MPSKRDEVGFRRGDFPEFMAWAEVVAASTRTDASVRQMRREMDDFPVPVQILGITPIWLASEITSFFDKYPRRALITDEVIRQLQGLYEGGASASSIAQMLELDVRTVNKYLAGPNI